MESLGPQAAHFRVQVFESTMRVPESLKRPVNILHFHDALKNKIKEKSPSAKPEEVVPSNALNNSDETLGAQCPTESLSFKEIPAEAYKSAKPLLALLKAYECKVSYKYEFDPASSIIWYVSLKDRPDEQLLVQRLALVGASIILEGDDFGVLHVNLLSEMGNAGKQRASQVGLSFDNYQIVLNCSDTATKNRLENLRLLSIFEYVSIFKALTGSVISTVGVRMPDMHLVLSSAFNFKDWCEVYWEGQGWVKLWCHIRRVKKSSKGKLKGRCQIRFYKDDKCNKLVCFIPETEYVQDVFFDSDRSDKSSTHFKSSTRSLLDSLTMIKILGNVCYPSESRSRNFLRSRSSIASSLSRSKSRTSLVSMITPSRKKATADSVDVNGQVDGNGQADSTPTVNSAPQTDSTPPAESVYSGDSSAESLPGCVTQSGGLLIKPLVHGGLGHLESLIRFIVPMMDCARKYGRPGEFKKDRYDPDSLMFGLPRLPSVDYFAKEEMERILKEPLPEIPDSSETATFAMSYSTSLLNDCIQKNPERESHFHFQKLSSVLGPGNDEKSLQIPQARADGGPLSVTSNSVSLV